MEIELNIPKEKELGKEELQRTIGGGIFSSAVSTFAFMYAIDIAVNWNDHVNAFKEGYNRARN